MATTTITLRHLFNFLTTLLPILFLSALSAVVASRQFRVGGSRGWVPPDGHHNSTALYNQWATANRFHVGDFLLFVYASSSNESDPVLLVNSTSYANCIPSHPILRLDGSGNTTFQFDRPGLFYFISGRVNSCIAGQKLVVRVMAEEDGQETEQDHHGEPTPAPAGNDDLIWDGINWPPAVNSTVKMTIASYFITALGGVLVILYLLM